MNDNSYKVIEVDINEILPNRFQPRIQFDEEEILELSDSIKEHGVIQPLVVRAIGDKYEIIAGERRYKASVLAGKETVPVIIKNLNDKDSAEIALIENIQRKNLTPIEEALSYKKILDMGYITQENLAIKLGKSQSSVANKIRLLNLSDEVQEALLDNKISERHARSLLRLKSSNDQNKMLSKIVNERLTVRKTDEEIDKLLDLKGIEEKEIKEEKGEEIMNNEFNQIPNVVTQPANNNFDIFATPSVPTQQISSMPVVPEIQVPPVSPVVEIPQMGGIQFDAQGNVIAAPSTSVTQVPSMPVVPEVQVPPVSPVVEIPQMGVIQFDAQGNVIAAPSAPVTQVPSMPVVPEVPATSVAPILEVPITSPIIESTPIMDSMPKPAVTITEPSTINEVATQGPIIITDYTKQYDPIMPTTTVELVNKVDFKEIITAIRECSAKIEQYGYKIDVEEYDLTTLYQVVFKIEK